MQSAPPLGDQFPWETISQPNAFHNQVAWHDVQPKHFFFLFHLIISIYAAYIQQILKVNNVSHKTNG